jgi:ABC-type enterochelin transport system permease subunit
MKLSDNVYLTLKWICLLAVPLVTFITSISDALNFPYGSQVAAVVSALGVFAGAVIKISSDNYYKQNNDDSSINDML